jgi:hypothetical protein
MDAPRDCRGPPNKLKSGDKAPHETIGRIAANSTARKLKWLFGARYEASNAALHFVTEAALAPANVPVQGLACIRSRSPSLISLSFTVARSRRLLQMEEELTPPRLTAEEGEA